jgi:D-lactate dehydrogenase
MALGTKLTMKVLFFDTHGFEQSAFLNANLKHKHELHFEQNKLNSKSAKMAQGYPAVCAFANDQLDAETLKTLAEGGTQLVALRCAGYNHVDLDAARSHHMTVLRVPEYSPYAVAEHAVALLLTLNRKIHRAYNRTRENNFSLEGLIGFDLHGKKVGIIGTGKIGSVMARIMAGFGCELLLYDLNASESLAAETKGHYMDLKSILAESDIVSLHVPLVPQTRHLLNSQAFESMKKGVYIVNTGRGGLIDTTALITQLKRGHIGGACLDVYEEEEHSFFRDLSAEPLLDDTLARLLSFPNVLLTSHQGFLTREALTNIAETTLQNVSAFEHKLPLTNQV